MEKMKIKKEINLVEVCSELADLAIVEMENLTGEMAIDVKDGVIFYTEKYQDIFNRLYDEYWEFLEKQGFKHVNN